MTELVCPQGHANPGGSRYCVVCGSSLESLPMPPTLPQAALPPFIDAPGQVPPKRRRGLWIGLSAFALVAIVAVASVIALGGNDGSTTAAPLTASQARAALLSDSDAPRAMVSRTDEITETDSEPFSVDDTADCRIVIGAERMGDISPDIPPGDLAYPPNARGAETVVGVDFEDTSSEYVSGFAERVLVFPSTAEAGAYIGGIRAALPGCLTTTSNVSTESTKALYRADRAVTSGGGDLDEPVNDLTWSQDSRFDSVGLVDISFSMESEYRVVVKGPNVLIVDWTKDSDDPTPAADYRAAADEAVRAFSAAVAEVG